MLTAPIPKRVYEKVERFFCEEALAIEEYARAIVECIGFKEKFDLCLDRFNWKYGDKDINYIVLSWRINKKFSVPLIFVELDKVGYSNAAERIDLLRKFAKEFVFDRIKSLMADWEFIGQKWFQMLEENNIPYYIPMKDNALLP